MDPDFRKSLRVLRLIHRKLLFSSSEGGDFQLSTIYCYIFVYIKTPVSQYNITLFKLTRKPLFMVMNLSVALPPQHFDKKEVAPQSKNFTVLCFFPCLVCIWKILEQLMMHLALGYKSLKIWGMFVQHVSRSGHFIRNFK